MLALLIENKASMKIKNASKHSVFHLVSSHNENDLRQLCLAHDSALKVEFDPENKFRQTSTNIDHNYKWKT